MQAYILVNCSPLSEKEIISEIQKLGEVTEVNGIMGIYDILVKVQAKESRVLDNAVQKVRSIKGIEKTYTMPIIYGQGGSIDQED